MSGLNMDVNGRENEFSNVEDALSVQQKERPETSFEKKRERENKAFENFTKLADTAKIIWPYVLSAAGGVGVYIAGAAGHGGFDKFTISSTAAFVVGFGGILADFAKGNLRD